MSVHHRGNPLSGPVFPEATDTCPGLAPGDIVRWQERLATVTDVADFHEGGTFVVLEFIDRKQLPLSLPLEDLQGADVWHRADRPIDLRPYDGGHPSPADA